MKLRITHHFRCTAAEYLKLIDDPEFEAMLARESAVKRELLSLTDEGGVRRKRVRCTPDRELPGFVAKLVGSKQIVYDQVNEIGPDGVLHWRVEPAVAGEKVSVRGTMRLFARADGVERVVEGDVDVRVPLIGGQIEKVVVGDVERSYDKAARAIAAWIDGRR